MKGRREEKGREGKRREIRKIGEVQPHDFELPEANKTFSAVLW